MRFAKYFDKDLYSKWHRLWEGIAMADVDSVEICRNKGCWKPLAIIEHLYDTGSDKKKYTNIVEQIGKGLNIPVYTGASKPQERIVNNFPTFIHGNDGFGNINHSKSQLTKNNIIKSQIMQFIRRTIMSLWILATFSY